MIGPMPLLLAAMPAEVAAAEALAPYVAIRCTGIGPDAAARAVEASLASLEPSAIISWGTAGALEPSLRPGQLLVYADITDAGAGQRWGSTEPLTSRLLHSLRPLRALRVSGISNAHPLARPHEKAALRAELHGQAVDMESAALAAAAARMRIPFVAIRAIVDPAGAGLPASALAGLEEPAHATSRTLRALARRPWELPALVRLALWYAASLRSLRAAALMLASTPGAFAASSPP